ncbi:MAG: hypothetical protein EHM35_10185 [Planctomycetaceae bacterium]|nr:MAG: hypothetical protein EHM35_10185 [Planctomycetaceae bacterium]
MRTFVIRDVVDHVLVPLPTLLERLPFLEADFWVFRNIEVENATPFGLAVDEFESRTRETPGGFRVTAAEFRAFLQTDFQIVDGFIEGTNQEDPNDWLFQIECFDSSEWDISVKSPELAAALERSLERIPGGAPRIGDNRETPGTATCWKLRKP